MSDAGRWLVGLLVALAIVALILIARGEQQRGEPVESPAAAIVRAG
jgi:hypothetical protein